MGLRTEAPGFPLVRARLPDALSAGRPGGMHDEPTVVRRVHMHPSGGAICVEESESHPTPTPRAPPRPISASAVGPVPRLPRPIATLAETPPPRPVQMRLDLAATLRASRPTLGDQAGIALYRLLRDVAFVGTQRDGGRAAQEAGKRLGLALALPSVDDFLHLCMTEKLGLIRIPVMTDRLVRVDIYECLACSGLDRKQTFLCDFEGGLIAGMLEGVTHRSARAHEISCIGGGGDEACGFEIEIR